MIVLGSSGFIGQAVPEALAALDQEAVVRTMVRSRPDSATQPLNDVRIGDVRDLDSLRKAMAGADTVVHAASYVGYDPELCRTTNVDGTTNVVAASAAAGVNRIVYLSTASVYGSGPHRGPSEEEVVVAPSSPLSRSRADAEKIVLDAGGIVVRPDMVYGAGDRWFVPGFARFVRALGGLVDGGSAKMSMINVDDLAAVISRLALAPQALNGPFHAAYTEPNTVSELTAALSPVYEWKRTHASVQRITALASSAKAGFTERQFELLTTDHWYDVSALTTAIGADWGAGFGLSEADIDWYRSAAGLPARPLTTDRSNEGLPVAHAVRTFPR